LKRSNAESSIALGAESTNIVTSTPPQRHVDVAASLHRTFTVTAPMPSFDQSAMLDSYDITMHEVPNPPTILVVDDDVAVRSTMARFLGFEGFAIVEAANGREALSHLRTGCSASAILLDLRMPVMDGWTFRRAQQNDPSIAHIPVIILSGADAHRFPELDAVAAFEKPVAMAQIAKLLRRLLT
jgi:CheY-like chemotaxis protein